MRIVGYILVFLCPAACGLLAAAQVRGELERLSGLISLVGRIKYEIEAHMAPLDKIFAGFSDPALEKCGFCALLRAPADGGGNVLGSALEKAGEGLVCPEARDVIRGFADSLGRLDGEEQSRRCVVCLSALEEIRRKKREKAADEQKLCRWMGLLAGGAALITFI